MAVVQWRLWVHSSLLSVPNSSRTMWGASLSALNFVLYWLHHALHCKTLWKQTYHFNKGTDPIGPFTRRNTQHWIWLICIVQAVVNEDASGEMIALRREIQRLKVSIVLLSNWRILHHPTIVNLFLYYCFLCDPTAKINIYMWIWKQEELNSLRSQTLSSMRRERRRESDEFFRLSITPKAIFSPALEDHVHVEEDEPTLTTEELLEKVLHMNLWNNSHHQTILVWSHFLRITTTILNTLLSLVQFTNVMTQTKSGVRWHRSKHWRLYWQEPWDEN